MSQLNECSRQCSRPVLARCSMGFAPNPLINGVWAGSTTGELPDWDWGETQVIALGGDVHCRLCTVHSEQCTVHSALCTVHCSRITVHGTLFILH